MHIPLTCLPSILAAFLADLHRVFSELHFTYLELNPVVLCPYPDSGSKSQIRLHLLDAAAKLDQCAEYLMAAGRSASGRWSLDGLPLDFPASFGCAQSEEEAFVAQMDSHTGASMKLTLLNPEGRIWTMNAGGGASVIYADTVVALAPGGTDELANYGEYSGSPSEEQTYAYAKTILSLMTRGSPHPKGKILLIGGGVANFTNVAVTFKGIKRALVEFSTQLIMHQVRIFIRRGGPNYEEGLRTMLELGEFP
ncbi:unnamed protein product [Protopolystoma xenopodis]|uniref:ATP-citrate synthase citrate-binding domain-containing protein n=1 Tax=Protopolystoma xenopodis TaxID=117903 RepID=A0A3S5AV12_9PLAT|nr:unnamed protein product [Protopolystoma xenopodis]